MRAPIRYARSGDVNIAYQVTGEGEIDLVLVPGFVSHLELDWDDPRSAHFLDRLGSFTRLIRFDKRGTGLSDRPGGLPDLETRMDDVRAVMDAVGSERAALFGYSEGGPLSVLFAATMPERVSELVLYGAYAKRLRSGDYPWAPTEEERLAYAADVEGEWGFEADMRRMCPSADEAMARWWEARARAAASPGAARALVEMNSRIDVRDVLPSVHLPPIVLHRTGDLDSRPEEGRYIAERIPGAHFVELPGGDQTPGVDPHHINAPSPQLQTRHDPVHRHRAVHRAGSAGRRPRLDGSAQRPPPSGPQRAHALLGRGGEYHRRRVPRDLRWTGARDSVGASRVGGRGRSRARGARRRPHR